MKRIIVLMLTFIMLLSVTTTGVATSDNNEDNAYSAMDFGIATGMVTQDMMKEPDVLTRGTLAIIYHRIITGQADMSDYTNRKNFADVPYDYAGAANLVTDMKILNDENGVFGWNKPVKYDHLVKSMVVFLGYQVKAESLGGYPSGYLAVATQLGFTKTVKASGDAIVNVSAALEMLRQAIDVDMMSRELTTAEPERYVVVEGDTYISRYMHAKSTHGIVTANMLTDLRSGSSPEYGKIKIDNIPFLLTESTRGAADLLGYSINVIWREVDGWNEVVYFEPRSNDVKVIEAADIQEASGYNIHYYKNGKRATEKIDSSTYVVYNGTVMTNYDETNLNPFTLNNYDGKLTFIDNNRDSKYDVLFIDAYETIVVADVIEEKVFSKFEPISSYDLSGVEKDELQILNILGEPIPITEISPDDILCISKNINGKIKKVVVAIDSAQGAIEEIAYNEDGKPESFTISGTNYKCSNSFAKSLNLDEIKLGKTVKVYFDCDGMIAYLEIVKDTSYKVGYLTAADKDGLRKYCVKIFEQNNLFAYYNLSEKVKINGERYKDKEAFGILGIESSGEIKRQIIKYHIDTEGNIDEFIVVDNSKDADGFFTSEFFQLDGFDGKTPQTYKTDLYTFGLKAFATANTIIFDVPVESKRDEEELYQAYSRSVLQNSKDYSLYAYGSNKYSPIIEYGVREIETVFVPDYQKAYPFMVVQNIKYVITEDDEYLPKIEGFYRTTSATYEYGEYFAKDEDVLKIGENGALPQTGDIIKYDVDGNGKIRGAMLVLDKSNDSLFGMDNPNDGYPSTPGKYIYGDVLYSDDTYLTIGVQQPDGTYYKESYPVSRFINNGTLVYRSEGEKNYSLRKATKSDIRTMVAYPGNHSKAFVFISSAAMIGGVIYNEQ